MLDMGEAVHGVLNEPQPGHVDGTGGMEVAGGSVRRAVGLVNSAGSWGGVGGSVVLVDGLREGGSGGQYRGTSRQAR